MNNSSPLKKKKEKKLIRNFTLKVNKILIRLNVQRF
jgi:hypothetical protein